MSAVVTFDTGRPSHMGPLGSAAVMKVAVNLVLPVQMLAFSEAILLAENAGGPPGARGGGAAPERGRLAHGDVPRAIRPRDARRGLVRRGNDAEGSPARA